MIELVTALVGMEEEFVVASSKRESVEKHNVAGVLQRQLFNRKWDVGWHTDILQ